MVPILRLVLFIVLLTASVEGQEINEKAARYFESLQKRPAAGPVFDRFVDAWLDTDTLEHLETWLSERVKAQPSAAGHLLLGLYHVRQGAHAKAVEHYRAALVLEPANAALWQQKAIAESRLLEFDQAIASLEKGLEQKPPEELSLAMRQLLGRLLSRAGRTGDALTLWQKLMEERPDDEALREDVLDLQLAEGLYDAAVQNASDLVERAPDAYKKAMRRLQSADVLDRAARTDAALAELEKCLGDSGTDSWLEKEVLARFDRIFRRDDNLSGLRVHLDALVSRQPQRPGLQRSRVRLLAELGEKSAAVEAGRAMLAHAPGDRTMRDDFIALLVVAGRLDEAVAQTAELVRQAPQDRDLLLRLAALKLQAGDKPGCLAAVAEYDKLSGPDEAARLRSAALLERAGLADEVIARLKTAAAEFPASATVSSALAAALHKAKRRDEALAEWKRQAVTAGGTALLDLARTLSAHGEDEAAWELLSPGAENAGAPLLTQLCQLAERLDRAHEALPFVRRLASLAQSAPDMEAALELASRLIKRSGQTDEVITSIGAGGGLADLCLLAELLEQRGDSAGAEEALQRAGHTSPNMAAAQLVRLYRLRQAWPSALEAGAKMFDAPGGKKAATAQMLADVAERSRDFEEAMKWTREWRKLSPGAAPAVLAESRLLRSLGKDEESLKVLRLASGRFEENREIREELARASRDAGRTSEALSLYAGLYEQAPDAEQKLRIVREWAGAALESSRLPEMLEQFEERRRQNRSGTGPLLALAEIHAINGEREKQQRVLTEASRLRPDDADLALMLASMQEEDDLVPMAMDTLKAALPHDKSGRVRHRLARLHLSAGDQSEGMRLLEENPSGIPPDAAAVETMALSLFTSEPERAIALLRPYIQSDPADYRLRFLLASILAELGEHGEAIREWTALLGINQECPSVTARRVVPLLDAAVEAKLKQLASIVPDEIIQVLRVHELQETSPQMSNYYARQSGYQQAAQIRLPGNLAELRALTPLALFAAEESSEEAKAAITAALKQNGMEDLRALVALLPERGVFPGQGSYRYRQSQQQIDLETDARSTLKAPQNNGVSAGIKVLVKLLEDDKEVEFVAGRATWQSWHRTHPEFALTAGIAALNNSPVVEDWEKEVAARVSRLERPSAVMIRGVTRFLARGGIKEWDGGVTQGLIMERIAGWLESDWMAVPAMNGERQALAESMFKAASKAQDAAMMARLLNSEWTREEKATATGTARPLHLPSGSLQMLNSGGPNYRSGGSQDFLAPLVWPLPRIPGVSPLFAGNGVLTGLSTKQYGELTKLVKPPVLRAWLEDRASDAGHPLPALTKLAADPDADAAALLLAAVSAAEVENFDAAAGFVARALERPLPADIRRQANASIISWAEESMAAVGTPLLNAAREAALRLRRDAQSYEQKWMLASAMESLGISKEAKSLTAQGGAGWRGGIPVMRYAAGRPWQSQPVMLAVDRELKTGDRDVALRLATKLLRRQARHLLSPAGWTDPWDMEKLSLTMSRISDDDVTWPTLLKAMKSKGMDVRVLEALKPGAGADLQLTAVYAAVHELLGQKDRAIELYRAALAAGSIETGIHVRLTMLLMPQKEGEQHFVAAPAAAQAELVALFLPDGGREPLEEVLRAVELTGAALDRRDPALTAHFEWLNQIATLLREDLPIDKNFRAPKLEGSSDGDPLRRPNRPDPGTEEFQKAKAQLAVRRTAHDALCRRLLNVPGSAALAFSFLQSTAPIDTDLIMEAIAGSVAESRLTAGRAAALTPQQQALLRMSAMGRESASGLESVSVPASDPDTLLQYVLDDAVRKNEPGALRGMLVPALQKAGATLPAERVDLLAALYFNPAEQVEANARRLIATGGVQAWPVVIRGLSHRHARADIAPLLFAELTRARTQPDELARMAITTADYCDWLCREGRHDSARVLLERVVELLAGPARQRAGTLGSLAGGMGNSYLNVLMGSPAAGNSQPAGVVVEILKRLIASETSAFVALDILYGSILPGLSPETASAFELLLDVERAAFTKQEYFTDMARARAFFTNCPLLADVEEFRCYGGGSGVFVAVANALDSMGLDFRQPVLEFLRTQPAAFGRDVLIAAADDRWGSSALSTAAQYFDRIKALPPAAQSEVVDLLAALASGRDRAKLDDGGVALMKWVEQQQSLMLNEETARRIEWYLNPKSTGSQRSSFPNEPADAGAPLLEAAIRAMSPRAYDVVRRTSVLARRDTPQTMGWMLAGISPPGEFARAFTDQEHTGEMLPLPPDRSSFRLGVLTNTLCAGDRRTPLFVDPLRRALPRSTRWITDKLAGTTEERLTALVAALSPHVKEGEASVLLEAFPMPVTASDTAEGRAALRAAAIAWSDGNGKSLPRQDIVQEIAAAARLEESMETKAAAAGLTDEAALPPEQAHYLAVMRNESLTHSARLTVASLLADFAGPWLEPPLVAWAAAILERGLITRRPVDDWQRHAVLRVLARSTPSESVDSAIKSLLPRLPQPMEDGSSSAGVNMIYYQSSSRLDKTGARLMLKLALRTGDNTRALELVKRLNEQTADPAAIAIAIRSGNEACVAQALVSAGGSSYNVTEVESEELFDAALAEALTARLTQMENLSHRIQLELAVNCLPSAAGQKPRVERLQAIAAQLPAIFKTAGAGRIEYLLDLMTLEPVAALPLLRHYAELTGPNVSGTADQEKQDVRERRLRFWQLRLFGAAADGDLEQVTGIFEALLKVGSSSSFRDVTSKSPVLHHLCTGIAHGWPQWDGTKRSVVTQWFLSRLKNETLTPPACDGRELSLLPREVIEAINAAVE